MNQNGQEKTITIPKGTYILELFGAQGGTFTAGKQSGVGGLGGYTKGTLIISEEKTLILRVGGMGSVTDGGYKGGGAGDYDDSDFYGGAGGGGATDV